MQVGVTLVRFFFDMDKLQAGIRRIQFPKLQRQWKISFSLDPRYGCDIRLQTLPNQPNSPLASLTLTFGPLPEWRLAYQEAVVIADPVPSYGDKLVKVELTHERDAEDGRYTLALSVGDEVVGRVDADIFIADLNLFKMFVGQKTDIKRVVILDKP